MPTTTSSISLPISLPVNNQVESIIAAYPSAASKKIRLLRSLILDVVEEMGITTSLTETLKWGEPSYLVKGGSTLRIAWKAKEQDQVGMYFNCQTTLVDTFRELYGDLFSYQGNRAIVFPLEVDFALPQLKRCIELTLSYHKRKHLALLGAAP